MSLYVPTRQEIEHALDAAASLAPALWLRLVEAGCILRAGELVWNEQEWRCLDTRHGTVDPPRICRVSFSACTCEDCQGRRAVVHGEALCPHRLALLTLCDICLAHVCARRLGLTKDPIARAAARRVPGAGLLLMRYDGGRKLALVTAKEHSLSHAPVCRMAKVDGQLGFAGERDLAAFAGWLAEAPPLGAAPASLLAEEGKPLPHRFPHTAAAHLAALLI